jgi:high-affinity Fe2+/Pb2+ permease
MNNNSFKDYFRKASLWKIGLIWGLITGILVAIVQDKTVLKYFLSWEIVLQLLFFMIAGAGLFVLGTSYRLWKRSDSKDRSFSDSGKTE